MFPLIVFCFCFLQLKQQACTPVFIKTLEISLGLYSGLRRTQGTKIATPTPKSGTPVFIKNLKSIFCQRLFFMILVDVHRKKRSIYMYILQVDKKNKRVGWGCAQKRYKLYRDFSKVVILVYLTVNNNIKGDGWGVQVSLG